MNDTPTSALAPPPVMAFGNWKTNGDLIADVARLGYLDEAWRTLDMTYGLGTWWTRFRPYDLVGIDLDPTKSPFGRPVDFRELPWPNGTFDAVTFDPPYKLNGTPTEIVDQRYGVDVRASISGRHDLILRGLDEAARVVADGGYVLVKCQDQVASGRVQWQTDLVTEHAAGRVNRLDKVDSLNMPSYRAQPAGRRQVHARRNYSTLLVFRKER